MVMTSDSFRLKTVIIRAVIVNKSSLLHDIKQTSFVCEHVALNKKTTDRILNVVVFTTYLLRLLNYS